jgi:phage terminase large subunit-like protein
MFKCSKLQKVTHSQLPKSFKGMVRGWDLAASQDTGCFTVGLLLAHYHDARSESDRFYVLDVARKQTDDPISYMRDISFRDASVWSGAKIVHESQPAVGKLLDKQIAQKLRGLSVRSARPVGSKEDRWEPLAIALLHGELFMLEGAWNSEFVDEMESAPGKFVDQLDAAALAYQALVEAIGKGATTSAARSTKPRESERCLTDGCDRPAFESTGHCCDNCQRGGKCTPMCNHKWTDWFNKRMPTGHSPRGTRNFLKEKFR